MVEDDPIDWYGKKGTGVDVKSVGVETRKIQVQLGQDFETALSSLGFPVLESLPAS